MPYSKYDVDIKKFTDTLPDYLQTPGSYVMNTTRLYHDIMDNYKDIFVDLWKNLDLNHLESNYGLWVQRRTIEKGAPYDFREDDQLWKYNQFLETLCKTYDIIREHPVGILSNRHMIRLLKVKIMGVNFDGTREKLDEILNSLFGQTSKIRFLTQTRNEAHASANVFLIVSGSDTSFDAIDTDLFENGYYFLPILGIVYDYRVVSSDALIYDYTKYDTNNGDTNKYDEGSINLNTL